MCDRSQHQPIPVRAAPGQESVWEYPRPPRAEPSRSRIEVVLGGQAIIATTRSYRVLETSHPPTYYLPVRDAVPGALVPVDGGSWCEFKGRAAYFDLHGGDRVVAHAAWTYPEPTPTYAMLRGHVALYPCLVDRCTVDGEVVRPQPGGFYGGWVTDAVVGPFKGEPGTAGW